eukprot:6211126-Pleurochrysis_carterae.AAC.1
MQIWSLVRPIAHSRTHLHAFAHSYALALALSLTLSPLSHALACPPLPVIHRPAPCQRASQDVSFARIESDNSARQEQGVGSR